MPGEYQRAKQVLDEALAAIADEPNIHEETFTRALTTQIVEYYREHRTQKDIVSELEQHIRTVIDDGESVITRGS